MARMYEMNLVIRLQDRASARMRRISGDMSALARHAQSQNKLIQMQGQAQREQIRQGQALSNLRDMENKKSSTYQRNLSSTLAKEKAVFTARQSAQKAGISAYQREKFLSEATTDAQRARMRLTDGQRARLVSLQGALAAQLATEYKITEAKAAQNRVLEASILRETKLNDLIARRLALNSQADAQAARYGTGRKAAHAGSLAFMGGAVGLGLSALAAGSYASFDVRATKAATQLGGTNLQVGAAIAQTKRLAKELEVSILGLAKQYPSSAAEMADASYNIFSSMDLGSSAVERMKNGVVVLTEANKAAQGGQVDLATATDTLITVFNDFLPATTNLSTAIGKKELSKSMAELFSIVRFMRGGFTELSAGMNKLAPAAKQSKQTLIEVGAAFAVVTQAIPSAAQASTAEARLLDLFGTEQFINGMKKAGASITVMKNGSQQLIPLYDILDKIVSLDPSLQLGGPKLTQFVKEITQFGSDTGKGGSKGLIQMQRALTILITQHYKHRNILRLATQDVSEYDKSVKALADTADQKYKTAVNNLKVAWIQFGQAVMPTLLVVLNTFTRIFSVFTNLSKNHRETIGFLVVISGLLLTVGGLFSSAFGGITMVLATMRLRKIEQAIKDIDTAQQALNATNVEAKAGWLAYGKSLLKVAGWIGVVVLSYETLKGVIAEFRDQDIHGNFAQKIARGWGSQFKSAEGFAAGIIDRVAGTNLKQQSDKMWEDVFNSTPSIFGRATMKQSQDDIDKLTDAQKEAAAAAVKAGNSKLDAIIKLNNAATQSDKKLADYQKSLAKETTRAKQEALKQQKSDVESAAKNLLSKYKELEAANTAAIGGILSGPISGGPVMSAFSGINQTLMGLGIKPIKIPLEFIMQDATAQQENFKLWRDGLQKLSKRLPPEMIVDLRAAGIGKLPEILSLADASPAFLAQYKKVWTDTKAARDAATKADMDSTLALWNSYGKDIAWQIVNGLVDSGAEAKMYDSFSKMITTTFAGQLTKSMNDAVAQSIKDWKETHPIPKVTAPATATQDKWALNQIWQEMHPAISAAEYSANQAAHGWKDYNPNLQMKISGPPFSGGRGGRGKSGGGGGAFATGGIIPGSGNRDSVPAMLTPGELVLNKRHIANASAMLGTANNADAVFDKVQHFGLGGKVLNAVTGHGKVQRAAKWTFGGKGGLGELGKEILSSFTNDGLKAQGKAIWNNLQHPTMRGGQMIFPGGRPGAFKSSPIPWGGSQFKAYVDFALQRAEFASQAFRKTHDPAFWSTPEGFSIIREIKEENPIGKFRTYGLYAGKDTVLSRANMAFEDDVTRVTGWEMLNQPRTKYHVMPNDLFSMLEPAFYRGKPISLDDWPHEYDNALKELVAEYHDRFTPDTRLNVIHHKDVDSAFYRLLNEQRATLDPTKFNKHKWFHGSTHDWKTFDLSRSNPHGLLGPGLYLSRLKDVADTYSTHWATGGTGEDSTVKSFKFLPEKVFGWDDPVPLAEFKRIWKLSPHLDRFAQMSERRILRRYKMDERPVYGVEVWNALSESIHQRLASKDPEFGLSQDLMDQVTKNRISRHARTQVNQILSDAGFDAISMDYSRGFRNDVVNILPRGMDKLTLLSSKPAVKRNKGGWVPGVGNSDTVPAWLTPGEYVVSKPMINSLTKGNTSAGATTNVTHETNINVDVSNPTGKAIVDALNPVLFGLRHKP